MSTHFPETSSKDGDSDPIDTDENHFGSENGTLNPLATEFTPSFMNPSVKSTISISSAFVEDKSTDNGDFKENTLKFNNNAKEFFPAIKKNYNYQESVNKLSKIYTEEKTKLAIETVDQVYLQIGTDIKKGVNKLIETFNNENTKCINTITELKQYLEDLKADKNKEIYELKANLYDAKGEIKSLECSSHRRTTSLFLEHLNFLISTWEDFCKELEESIGYGIPKIQILYEECLLYQDELLKIQVSITQKLESKLNGFSKEILETLIQIPEPPFDIFNEKKVYRAIIKDYHFNVKENKDKAIQTNIWPKSVSSSVQTISQKENEFDGFDNKKEMRPIYSGRPRKTIPELPCLKERQENDLTNSFSMPKPLSRCTSTDSLYSISSICTIGDNKPLLDVYQRITNDVQRLNETFGQEQILKAIEAVTLENGGTLNKLKYKYVVQKVFCYCPRYR